MNENQNEYVDINAHDNYPDSEQTIEIPTMKVIPLKKICMTIGALPTAYLETMSYYEMLIWFIEYLKNNIIPTVNNNAEAIQEVQSVVLALQNYINDYKDSIDSDVEELEEYMNNYFENLDVQEEINNKLDDMLEDGVLEQIIEQFLQLTSLICFDNVADMKTSPNLANGSYAKTLGYHTKNDGGEALYKIRTITNDDVVDEAEIIEMNDNTLIAELISTDINPNMYGAYGDGVHDDTQAIQKAFNNTRNLKVSFLEQCTYLISAQITLTKNIIIDFNFAKILSNHQDACIFISGNVNDIQTINNLYFDGNYVSNYGLKISDNRFTKVFSPKIRNCKLAGIYVFKNLTTGRGAIFANDVSVQNDITTTAQYNACANSIGIDIENTDSQIMNGSIKDCKTSIKCSSSTLIYGVHAWNYYEEFVKDGNIMVDASGGVRMIGCYCDGIPTMIKQNIQTTYSNVDIASCIYHYVIGDQSIAQFTPVPIIKGTADKVNISNSTFETNFYNQNFAIANTFELLFVNNTFCSKAYYENYYQGTLTEEGKGTLYYERINDVVYYKYDGIQAGTSDVSFTDRIPTWARPSKQVRLTPSGGATNNVTITNNGEVLHVTTTAWSSGQTSYPARYGLQKYNP